MIKFKEFCEKFYKKEPQFLTEMSKAVTNYNPNMSIWVESPQKGRDVRYFKLYNSNIVSKATKVARISFKKVNYLDHVNSDGKDEWILNNKEKRELIDILTAKSAFNNITNWKMVILVYNDDNFGIDRNLLLTNKMTKSEYEEIVKDINKDTKDERYKALSLDLPIPDYMKLEK